MCAEAPVPVFQLAAAGVDSQDKRSAAETRAEAWPALTVAALADFSLVSCDPEAADDAAGVSEVSCLRWGLLERCCMGWEARSFAFALASRLLKHWSSEWLGRPQNAQESEEAAWERAEVDGGAPGWFSSERALILAPLATNRR